MCSTHGKRKTDTDFLYENLRKENTLLELKYRKESTEQILNKIGTYWNHLDEKLKTVMNGFHRRWSTISISNTLQRGVPILRATKVWSFKWLVTGWSALARSLGRADVFSPAPPCGSRHNFLFNEGRGIKRSWRQTDHSSPLRAKIENTWHSTSFSGNTIGKHVMVSWRKTLECWLNGRLDREDNI